MNGTRRPIFKKSSLHKPLGHIIFRKLKVEENQKIPSLFEIRYFDQEDNDLKPFDFNGGNVDV